MATTTVGRTTIQGATTVGGFNPATLFSAGEQGVWYDPSDFSTLFQDSAGTIPVTALEQPVGRMLDKSGRGNTATQATSANRPVVSARVNLLTYSNAFSSASWTSSSSASLAQNVLGPDNVGSSGWTITATSTSSNTGVFRQVSSSGSFTYSVYAKAGTSAFLGIGYSGSNQWANFDLSNGTVASQGSGSTASISLIGNGWYRCSFVATSANVNEYIVIVGKDANPSANPWNNGNMTNGNTIYIYGADFRASNQGVGLPVYQRVGAAVAGTSTTVGNADYDANGFPVYLKFDGSNDFLQVASYTMPLINRMTMVGFAEDAAVASQGCVSVYPATGNDYDSQTGYVFCPSDRTTARFVVVGSTGFSYFITWTTSPSSIIPASVITEDKQTSIGYLRVNGTQVGSDNAFTQFSANSNGGLLLGARWLSGAVDTSYRLNGRIYGVIIRGVTSTANQIAGAENWLNQKTAAY